MQVYASFKSINTSQGLKTFRYNTEFQSIHGPGQPIGLIIMLNPGDAKPESVDISNELGSIEFDTNLPVLTKSDKTMDKVKSLIRKLYISNNRNLMKQFTIHIENLFNLREKNNEIAKKLAKDLKGHDDLMFKTRSLESEYEFVFFAWGNTNINKEKQNLLRSKYPNAISVHKLNHKGNILEVKYPVESVKYFV